MAFSLLIIFNSVGSVYLSVSHEQFDNYRLAMTMFLITSYQQPTCFEPQVIFAAITSCCRYWFDFKYSVLYTYFSTQNKSVFKW